MKNVKTVISSIALVVTLATSTATQAIELVKVEALNNQAISVNINTELAMSLKEVNNLVLNVEESAQALLVTQNEKQFNVNDSAPILVSVAD